MYVESEIEASYQWAEPFERSYFSFLDEYDALHMRYLALFCGLEETLEADGLNALTELLETAGQMERFHTLHAFREGVRLARRQI